MNGNATFIEQRRAVERRVIDGRRKMGDRRMAGEGTERSGERTGRHDYALDLLGSVLAVVASVVVLVFTGLLEGAQSAGVQIMLSAAVVYAFVVAFRRAFYS